jgi:hypothetical protein
MFVPAQAIIAKWLESFKEFPPRAKAASFTVSDAMEKIEALARPRTKHRCAASTDASRMTAWLHTRMSGERVSALAASRANEGRSAGFK